MIPKYAPKILPGITNLGRRFVSPTKAFWLSLLLTLYMSTNGALNPEPLKVLGQPTQASADDPLNQAIANEQLAAGYKFQWNRDALKRSIESYSIAAKGYKGMNMPGKAAADMLEIAELLVMLGDKHNAEITLTSAIESLTNKNDAGEKAKLLSRLSLLVLETAKKDNSYEGKKYLLEAMRLADQSTSASVKAYCFKNAGLFNYFSNESTDTIDLYKKSIDFARQSEDTEIEADALSKLGYAYGDKNEYALALDSLDQALAKSKYINDVRGQALAYTGIGFVYNMMNEKQKALEYYQKADQLIPRDIDYFNQAILNNNLGSIYEYFGDYPQSLQNREAAFQLFKLDDHLTGQLATLVSLGRLSCLLEKNEEAIQYFELGEKLARKLDQKFYLALIRQNRGSFYLKNKQFEKAKVDIQSALAYFQSINNSRQISLAFMRLGEMELKTGTAKNAQLDYEKALLLNQKVRDQFTEADVLYELALLQKTRNNDQDALILAKKSIDITETLSSSVFNSQLKSNYISNVYDRYELYINLLMRMDKKRPGEGFAITALEANEQARARVILENIQLSDTNFARDAPSDQVRREKELANQLNTKRTKLTDMLSANVSKEEIKQTEDEARAIETEIEAIKDNLKQISPIYSSIRHPDSFDPAKFMKDVLDEDSLFMEFSMGNAESYLWLVDKNEVDCYVLPSRGELEPRIEKVLELLRSREHNSGESVESYDNRIRGAEKDYQVEASRLSHELLGPVAYKLKGKRLIFAPDGTLGSLPFAALPFPDSDDDRPLIATNEILYEPSGSALSLLKKTGERLRTMPAKDLLVFADPVFAADDGRLREGEPGKNFFETSLNMLRSVDSIKNLTRLPASGEEAESIGGFSNNSTIFRGFEANRENALSEDLKNYRVIHFATHGILNEQHPELSGILLSLYDEHGSPSEGFIRSQDIFGMNLNADLVVLSACNSGIGKEVRGEGMASLSNAFLQAGSRSVVSSLWKVDDDATQELMRDFYQSLSGGIRTPSQALRDAQIKMMADPRYHSPFYWAAFTAQGDINGRIIFTSKREFYVGITTLLIALAILLILGYRKWGRLAPN